MVKLELLILPPEGSTYNIDSTEITPSASLGENYNEAIEIDVPEFLTIELNSSFRLTYKFCSNYRCYMPNGMAYSNVEECYFELSGDITLSEHHSRINEWFLHLCYLLMLHLLVFMM